MSIAHTWGTTEAERALPFACDRFVARVDAACRRHHGASGDGLVLELRPGPLGAAVKALMF